MKTNRKHNTNREIALSHLCPGSVSRCFFLLFFTVTYLFTPMKRFGHFKHMKSILRWGVRQKWNFMNSGQAEKKLTHTYTKTKTGVARDELSAICYCKKSMCYSDSILCWLRLFGAAVAAVFFSCLVYHAFDVHCFFWSLSFTLSVACSTHHFFRCMDFHGVLTSRSTFFLNIWITARTYRRSYIFCLPMLRFWSPMVFSLLSVAYEFMCVCFFFGAIRVYCVFSVGLLSYSYASSIRSTTQMLELDEWT